MFRSVAHVVALISAACLGGCASQAAPSHLGGPRSKPDHETMIKEAAARPDGVVGRVTAESNHGRVGTVSGLVRRTARGGLEVQTPGGSWYGCERTCSDTLRRQTIDFWDNHGPAGDSGKDGPGYFIWSR